MTSERLSRFDNGPLTFDVLDTGPIDGTPVVLLHGFPQRASSWSGVAAHLHEHGLRTYAPDQRGYSPGARPRSRFGYRLSDLVEDVVVLIEAIGAGPVHLVGHDWGAAVAWSLAGTRPDLVATLTAVSLPHPAAFMRAMTRSNQALKSSYMALFQLPWLPELALQSAIGRTLLKRAGMSPEMIGTFRTDVVEHGALRGGLGWYRSLLLPPRGTMGGRVSVPTTYVWSDGDVALGRAAAEMTAQWVTGPYELEIFRGASHWIPDQRPAELAASIVARTGT